VRSIGSFFDKFRNIRPPDKAVREACIKSVKSTLGVSLSGNQIKVQRDSVHINAPSPVKSEIMLSKQRILEGINKDLASEKRKIKNVY
jgi:hypothetical protein